MGAKNLTELLQGMGLSSGDPIKDSIANVSTPEFVKTYQEKGNGKSGSGSGNTVLSVDDITEAIDANENRAWRANQSWDGGKGKEDNGTTLLSTQGIADTAKSLYDSYINDLGNVAASLDKKTQDNEKKKDEARQTVQQVQDGSWIGYSQPTDETNAAYESLYGNQLSQDQNDDNALDMIVNAAQGAGSLLSGNQEAADSYFSRAAKGADNTGRFLQDTVGQALIGSGAAQDASSMDAASGYFDTASKNFDDALASNVGVIDDGTADYNHATSIYVTGDQAKRQFEQQGLDASGLKDDQIYNKSELQTEYGYVPYVPDDASAWNMALQNVASQTSKGLNAIANARNNLANDNYGITIDGKHFTAGDYDRDAAEEYFENVNKELQEHPKFKDEETGIVWDNDAPPLAVSESGNPQLQRTSDGGLFWAYSNDPTTGIKFDGIGYDSPEAEVTQWIQDLQNHDKDGSNWKLVEPDAKYTTKNGEELDYGQMKRLYNDMSANGGDFQSDANISYDWGPLNIFKPQEAMTNEEMFTKDGQINLSDVLPQLADVTGQSMQYFLPLPSAFALSSLQALDTGTGVQRNANGELTKSSALSDLSPEAVSLLNERGISEEEYKDALKKSQGEKALGTALMPITEHLLGGINENKASKVMTEKALEGVGKILGDKTLAKRIGSNKILDWGAGTIGEGLEEIPSNFFEEAMNKGASSFYGQDYLKDNDGNIVFDESGNALYSYDPDGFLFTKKNEQGQTVVDKDKIDNVNSDALSSFEAGAGLGGVMTLPKLLAGVAEAPLRHKLNKQRKASSAQKYDVEGEWRKMDKEKK